MHHINAFGENHPVLVGSQIDSFIIKQARICGTINMYIFICEIYVCKQINKYVCVCVTCVCGCIHIDIVQFGCLGSISRHGDAKDIQLPVVQWTCQVISTGLVSTLRHGIRLIAPRLADFPGIDGPPFAEPRLPKPSYVRT